jgi:hypothetical protein
LAYEKLFEDKKKNFLQAEHRSLNDIIEEVKSWIVLNLGGFGIQDFPSSIFQYYEFLQNIYSSYSFRFWRLYDDNTDIFVKDIESWIVNNMAGDGIKTFPKTLNELIQMVKKMSSSNLGKQIYELLIKYLNLILEKGANILKFTVNFFFKYLLTD